MYIVGLTGGIGSGKTTVSTMLAERGAAVVDADVLAREVVEPGTDGLREVVETFGEDVLASDGSLDRAKLAAVVFSDEGKRLALNAIIHPRVGHRVGERLAELRDSDAIVVLDVPLLVEASDGSRRYADTIVVVATEEETQLDRAEARGMDRADTRARMATQSTLEDKLAVADHVLRNDGSTHDLQAQVDELWEKLQAAAAGKGAE